MNNPSVGRRRLLLGLAAASASAAAIPSAVALEATAEPENPELLRLGDQLAAVGEEREAAVDAYWAIVRKWNRRMPRAPEALDREYRAEHAWERDIVGTPLLPNGSAYEYPRWEDRHAARDQPIPCAPYTARELERRARDIESTMKRKRPRHPLTPDQLMAMEAERATVLDLLPIARRYELDRARWFEASGYAAAKERKEAAEKAVKAVAVAILETEEITMTGVLIKAEAMALWHEDPLARFDSAIGGHALKLANSILRIAGEVST